MSKLQIKSNVVSSMLFQMSVTHLVEQLFDDQDNLTFAEVVSYTKQYLDTMVLKLTYDPFTMPEKKVQPSEFFVNQHVAPWCFSEDEVSVLTKDTLDRMVTARKLYKNNNGSLNVYTINPEYVSFKKEVCYH